MSRRQGNYHVVNNLVQNSYSVFLYSVFVKCGITGIFGLF